MPTSPPVPSVEPPMLPRSAVLSSGDACEHRHWGLLWSSVRGREALYWTGGTHANTATGAFGGAPYGTTKPCTGLRRIRTPPPGPSVELPMGPRTA
eukprot:7697916-Pyramimonas_sp.AAC.1